MCGSRWYNVIILSRHGSGYLRPSKAPQKHCVSHMLPHYCQPRYMYVVCMICGTRIQLYPEVRVVPEGFTEVEWCNTTFSRPGESMDMCVSESVITLQVSRLCPSLVPCHRGDMERRGQHGGSGEVPYHGLLCVRDNRIP